MIHFDSGNVEDFEEKADKLDCISVFAEKMV
jgi:hypothetical protein